MQKLSGTSPLAFSSFGSISLAYKNLNELPWHFFAVMLWHCHAHILASIRQIPTKATREVCSFWIIYCPRPFSQHVRTAAHNSKNKECFRKTKKKTTKITTKWIACKMCLFYLQTWFICNQPKCEMQMIYNLNYDI